MDKNTPNTILITGGGGFLGNQLGIALLEAGINIKELVLSDIVEPRDLYGFEKDKRITKYTSDLSKKDDVDALFEGRTYTAIAAFHGLMSGGSEADFDLGMKANLDSTKFILEKIRSLNLERPPVFLYTSSGAVYGGDIPNGTVTDDTVPAPQSSYGIQKLICESLVYEWSRRGWIDARTVRLPTIMVRPGAPNTALSSYASSLVREPMKATVVSNFVHLMLLDGSKYPSWTRTTALPGISVTTREILDALAEVAGIEAVALVEIKPDPAVLTIVKTWPGNWETQRALALGCKRDENILGAVKEYKARLDQGRG